MLENVSVLLFCTTPGGNDVLLLLLQEHDRAVLPEPCELCLAPRPGEKDPKETAQRAMSECLGRVPACELYKELRDPSGRRVLYLLSTKQFDAASVSSSTRKYVWVSLGESLRMLEQGKRLPVCPHLAPLPGFVECLGTIFNTCRGRAPAAPPPGAARPSAETAPKPPNQQMGAPGAPFPQAARIDSISARRM